MKPDILLFFTFLCVRMSFSASLFGQFRGAMSNVERGVGKLLNDVVFDVKDTLHCTISAVEQVLAMNGLLDKTSDYNKRCRGFTKPNIKPKTRDYRHKSFFERRFESIQPIRYISSESRLEHISRELENSILNVNKSIDDILRRHETNSSFKVISELLKDETNRINAISDLLERELENISLNIRNEMIKLRMGNKKSPQDTIWEDLNALHYLKGKSNNKTEINQITKIIDRIVDEIHIAPSEKVLSEQEKLAEIKKQLSKYTSGKQNDQTDVLDTKEIVQTQISTEKEIKSFKDLAQNIMNKDNRNIADKNIDQVFKREATSQVSNSEKPLFDIDMASIDNLSPFYNPNLNTDTKKIVEDAKNIMEESKKSEELINNFFKEQQHSNADVFSNGNMFNFG